MRLRQLAEDALLMKRVAADIRLAGEVFRQISRGTGGHIPGAEQFVEYTLFYAAHSLGWGLFYGLSSRWPEWLIHELEFRGADIEEAYWCEGRSSGFRDAYDSRTFPEDVSMVVADR
ncbi:hypothetical protein B6B06_004287 [Salmonella enterica subsp. enterica serovar Berta]|nr:hypothetical protein [Salmonella enterica]